MRGDRLKVTDLFSEIEYQSIELHRPECSVDCFESTYPGHWLWTADLINDTTGFGKTPRKAVLNLLKKLKGRSA